MLTAVLVRAGELLAAAAIAGAVLLAVGISGVWWLKRRLRRSLRGARLALGTSARKAAADGFRAGGRRWPWSPPIPDRRWLRAAVARRRLWRSVSAAEHAVAQAGKSGAPIGDLDGLCRRLHRAAKDADRSLAMAGRATPPTSSPDEASSQAAELMAAAGLIQDAAAASAASVARPTVAALADDVRREVVALWAGLASAASSYQEPAMPAKPT